MVINLVCSTIRERFSSYLLLKEKVAGYEKAKSVQLSHCESKTLQAAIQRVPLKAENGNQDLVTATSIFPMCLVVRSIRVKEKERDLVRGQY